MIIIKVLVAYHVLSDVPEVLMITGADRDPDPRFELSVLCLFTMFTHSHLTPRPELQASSCSFELLLGSALTVRWSFESPI